MKALRIIACSFLASLVFALGGNFAYSQATGIPFFVTLGQAQVTKRLYGTGVGVPVVAAKSSSTSRNSTTTPAADPALTVSLNTPTGTGGGRFLVSLYFPVQYPSGTPDFKFRIDGTSLAATTVMECYSTFRQATGSAAIATVSAVVQPSIDAFFDAAGSGTADVACIGQVITSADSATAALYWSQNTSNASNVTIPSGGIVATRIL